MAFYNQHQQQQQQQYRQNQQYPQQQQPHPPQQQYTSSHQPPVFAAELDAPRRRMASDASSGMPMSPDGTPIFEMSGEPSPSSKEQGTAGGDRKPARRQETDPAAQANPWPFYLEQQQQQQQHAAGSGGGEKVAEKEGRVGGSEPSTPMANPWPYHGPAGGDTALSPTVTGAPSYGNLQPNNTGVSTTSDVEHGPDRLSTVSPISPAAGDGPGSLVPAPLSISRPQQPPKAYKAYAPSQADEEHGSSLSQDAIRPAEKPVGAGAEPPSSTIAYRPYRRPSFEAQEATVQSVAPTVAPVAAASTSVEPAASRPTSPPIAGTAPHHFRMPSPPPVMEPHVPRPEPSQHQVEPATATSALNNTERPSNAQSPAHASVTSSTATPTAGPARHEPEEVVLWPPQPASNLGSVGGTQPQHASPPVQAGPHAHHVPPPTQTGPLHTSAPTSTVTSPVLSAQYAYVSHPPPAQQQQQQQQQQPPTTPSNPGFVPQPTYASPSSSHGQHQPSSPQPSKPSSAPPQSPDQGLPQSPPPPYSQAFPPGTTIPSLPAGKPSLFPQPQPSHPLPHQQQQSQYPTQPTYAASSSSQHVSGQPSPHGPPSPYSPGHTPSPYGTAPTSPYQPAQYGQFPSPHTYAPQHQPQPHPQHPHSQPQSPPMYGHPPPQHGSGYGLAPPPLPPRPSSAHSYGAHPPHFQQQQQQQQYYGAPPVGFSSGVAPVAYPPPPKTNYVPGPGGPKPPSAMGGSSSSSYGYQGRPAAGGNKLFGSSVAKKWLDKTGQLVENKIEEILQSHPDPKYRPQQGQVPASQYPQHQQPQQQQYPPQQPQFAYNNFQQPQQQQQNQHYQPQPQYAHRGGGNGYSSPPPGR